MAWVRIHDGAMTHPKLVGLTDKAFRLWVWGLAYSQQHLTDGLIPTAALPARLKRAAGDLVAVVLWEPHVVGFKVHDYLEWNDSRDKVRDRQHAAKRRLDDWRDKQATIRAGEPPVEPPPNLIDETRFKRVALVSDETLLKPNLTEPNHKEKREEPASLSPPAPSDPFVDRAITERAGRFIDRYQVLYPQHRHGARYAVKPARDYAASVTLCKTWVDDGYLDKLAVIFLTTDHKFAEEGSRTIPQFLALASWCDGRLSEHEAKKRASA